MSKRFKKPLPKQAPPRSRPVLAITVSISLIGGSSGAAAWYLWPRPSCSATLIRVNGPAQFDAIQGNIVSGNCNNR